MTAIRAGAPVRGTQSMVGYMAWVFKRPSIVAIEIAWRWIFGIPVLFVSWKQLQQILAAYPLASSGFNSLDAQNPWIAIVQLASVWDYYQPHVFAVLRWLLPAGALFWAVISGLGRSVVLKRMDPQLPLRPASLIVLQAAWLALLGFIFCLWFGCMRWAAASHINSGGEPDLVGYAIWAIFFSLAFFTSWALISWTLSIAPFILLLENRSVLSSLGQSLHLGNPFTGKLAEVNLVMGIAKLCLIVLAMVFAAAPLPFSDVLGAGSLRVVTAASAIFYLVANDYFHVVRLKSFMEFWRTYRGSEAE